MTHNTSEPEIGLPLRDNGLAHSSAAAPKRRSHRKLLFVPLLIATLFTGAVVGMYFQPPLLRVFFNVTGLEPGDGTGTPIAVAIQKVQAQQEVAIVSEGDVVALGRIIPRGDVISVATPSGAGDARIAKLNVNEGDQVEEGAILAILDNLPQLESAVATAMANIRVAEANLVQIQQTTRASREEATAALERAEVTAAAAVAELKRVTSLFERGVTTRAEFDAIVARSNEAGRDVERQRATLSRFESGSEIVQADIAVAEANLAAAKVAFDNANRDVDRAYVRAPANGRVLDINARQGERPQNGGILELGDTSQMTVEAEVYQTLIGRVAIGDPVTVSAAALSQDLSGTVTAIGLEIGRQSITSDDPAANTDARVVDVIVTLDPASTMAAQRFTNLEALVRIDAGRSE